MLLSARIGSVIYLIVAASVLLLSAWCDLALAQDEVPAEETRNVNANFGFDLKTLSDLSANALFAGPNNLITAAGVAEIPQPILLMRMNKNSGLRR